MSGTDFLRLNEHKLFRELKDSLTKGISKTQNLLAVHDSVLFTWDFQNNCLLSLNIKAARSREGDKVAHQKLLPLSPPLFTPDLILVNETGNLLVLSGSSGVLVLQLPQRFPPFGAFDNNKELVYCKSFSLDERLLCYSDTTEVRQVKFHPGSNLFNHILVLTSDNMLRLYKIQNDEAVNVSVYDVGEEPTGMFPGSKTPFLDIYGEVAVDFDFGHPEIITPSSDGFEIGNVSVKSRDINVKTSNKIVPKNTNEKKKNRQTDNLLWPIYILRADLTVYLITINLDKQEKTVLKGPLPLHLFDDYQADACCLICLNTTPQIVCIGLSNCFICHALLLDIDEESLTEMKQTFKTSSEVPTKEILAFETVELEMGLKTLEEDLESNYKCPIFLHKDDSKVGRYYASHSAGVHSITISNTETLESYVNSKQENEEITSDIFNEPSKTEYVICTKTASSDRMNFILGFSLFYEPPSIIALLADGTLVTLAVLYTQRLEKVENIVNNSTTLKKMLSEPFDAFIHNILRKAVTQPILKLPSTTEHSQEQLYELLQRVAKIFREEYFKHHMKAREELDKRIQMLKMMKKNQMEEIKRMNSDKEVLQETASNLAEKYEDIKDKQDELLKRCEKLLMMVSRKKAEPSNAEKEFMNELQNNNEKLMLFQKQIDKIKNKAKYQQVQMDNWKSQDAKKAATVNEDHIKMIKANLAETTKKISGMIGEINEYKKCLNL